MSRIVCAWELGGGYGHAGGFLPLALALRARGHEVRFVMRDLGRAAAFLAPHAFAALQAPLWLGATSATPPSSYPEILARFGYGDATGLGGLVDGWRGLLDLLRPDLLVLDSAPTGLLAARGTGIARALYGTGFFSPPRVSPMPALRPAAGDARARLADAETRVLAVINAVLADRAAPPLARLADLLDADEDFLCTFSELDHYPERGRATYWGPRFNLHDGVEPAWPEGDGPTVFAYLHPRYRDVERCLEHLRALRCRALVHAPGLPAALVARHATARVAFAPRPVRMAETLRSSDVVLCHGGHGTTAASLLAGRPVLLAPMLLEQMLLARRVADQGLGRVVDPDSRQPNYRQLVRDLLADPAYAERARAFALRHQDFDQAHQLQAMVDRCEEILRLRREARPG